jgi:ubiquinone/menaquinone biosynthesis C-methylase UbiE
VPAVSRGSPRSGVPAPLGGRKETRALSQRSHGEFVGWAARHYDLVMDLLLLGRYQAFIEQAIGRMELQPGDSILDLGSGTARNICFMLDLVRPRGRIVGVDSSRDMVELARRRCAEHPQVSFLHQRIEEALPFEDEFDKVVVCFTLHSIEDEEKESVLTNAHRALKTGGLLWVLDFNEFELDRQSFVFRWIFRRIECELGVEFLSLDLRGILAGHGFGGFVAHPFLGNHVRLLGAKKLGARG